MKLSPIPDWGSPRRLALGALVVWALSLLAAAPALPRLARSLGDTDDAMRLTMVRDLASGRGWFDQKLDRLQPPQGVYMHWSRLVDGAEAGLLKLFGAVLAPDRAEIAMRVAWPLLWALPVSVAVLLLARRLGGGRAVFLGLVAAAVSFHASGEFAAGRIDHHAVQIACCLLAVAAAVACRPAGRWAAACGFASALGLAVGLEALPFLALVGAAWGLSWAFGRTAGRLLAAYGAALGLGALGLHALQSPPGRWFTPACDALAINLAAALAVAGLGVCLAAALGARAGRAARLALLALAAAAAVATYLAIEPLCLHGPMAAIDPTLKAVWLDRIREMAPWLTLLGQDPGQALALAAPALAGLAGWAWLARRPEARANPAWRLLGALLIVAIPLSLEASRYSQYALWFAAPLAAAAAADLAEAAARGLMIPAVLGLVALTTLPGVAAGRLSAGRGPASGPSAAGPDHACSDSRAFRRLAALPPGLVLSEIDEGPYVLAETPDAVVQAPYHRMGWGIAAARAALGAPPPLAEAQVRALKVRYIVDCPAHAAQSDRESLAAGSLQRTLDAGRVPPWLEPLSPPDEPLQVYRLR